MKTTLVDDEEILELNDNLNNTGYVTVSIRDEEVLLFIDDLYAAISGFKTSYDEMLKRDNLLK